MHIEPPNTKLESFKDFAKHYLMIVLSILTALGLEAWIEHTHHVHAAATASAQIEAEIRQNLMTAEHDRTYDLERMHALEKLRDELQSDIQAKLPDATILQRVRTELGPRGLYLDVRTPALRHEAWDVAVANQSAGWIDNASLHRFSAIYAAQAWCTRTITEDTRIVLDGPRMFDAMMKLRTGDIQPDQLVLVVNQMYATTEETSAILRNLIGTIRETMPTLGVAPTQPVAAH